MLLYSQVINPVRVALTGLLQTAKKSQADEKNEAEDRQKTNRFRLLRRFVNGEKIFHKRHISRAKHFSTSLIYEK